MGFQENYNCQYRLHIRLFNLGLFNEDTALQLTDNFLDTYIAQNTQKISQRYGQTVVVVNIVEVCEKHVSTDTVF